MPIYEFNCQKCQEAFEELVLSRSEKVVCPKCGSTKIERALSVFSHASGGSFRSSQGSACGGCAKSSCAGCGGH